MGAIAVTNPWVYPTYLAVIGIGALAGIFAIRRRWRWRDVARPAFWLSSLVVLSYILYLPFTQSYHTVFDTGIGLVRNITPQSLASSGICPDQNNVCPGVVHDTLVTPLRLYLEHFGLFVFVLASFLALLLWTQAGAGAKLYRWVTAVRFTLYYRDRLGSLLRARRAASRMLPAGPPIVDGSLLLGLAIVVAGLAVLQYFLLAFLFALFGLTSLLIMRLADRLPPAQLFLLALILVPVGLSILTQIVFVKDFLAGGPAFRMNTIFKFYNQAWVLYAVAAAAAVYYFAAAQRKEEPSGSHAGTTDAETRQPVAASSPEIAALPESVGEARSAETRPLLVTETKLALAGATEGADGAFASSAVDQPIELSLGDETAAPVTRRPWARVGMPPGFRAALALADQRPWWTLAFTLLLVASLIYTVAGTVSRETYRQSWLPESSVPLTLDGMAFMKVAYPNDYAGISWLNEHVAGAQVVAEAGGAYYNWRSRVSTFTGLSTIQNGIHEGEQRYADELSRDGDVTALYSSTSIPQAWQIIKRYGVRYIFVGFSERQCVPNDQCYSRAGLAKFHDMVGHGLAVAFHRGDVTIYRVTST
jgi:uncharacterized membrane protein